MRQICSRPTRSRPLRFFIQFDSKRASVPKVADYRNNHIRSRGSEETLHGIQPSAEEVSEWQVNQNILAIDSIVDRSGCPRALKIAEVIMMMPPSAVADWQND